MNTTRWIGLGILIIGIGLNYFPNEQTVSFFSGVIVGIGIGLIVSGKIQLNRK